MNETVTISGTEIDFDKYRLRRFVERLIEIDEVEIHEEPVTLAGLSDIIESTPKASLFRDAGPQHFEIVAAVAGSRRRLAEAFGVGEREVTQVEREVGIVDDRGRELGQGLLCRLHVVEREERLGAHDHGLDQVGLVVDEVERGLDRLERTVRISVILQQDPRRHHARHRIVGPQLGERAIVPERGLGIAACIRDGGGERHDVGVLAIDALHALEDRDGIVDAAFFQGDEAAFEIRYQSILSGHGRCIPPFASLNT